MPVPLQLNSWSRTRRSRRWNRRSPRSWPFLQACPTWLRAQPFHSTSSSSTRSATSWTREVSCTSVWRNDQTITAKDTKGRLFFSSFKKLRFVPTSRIKGNALSGVSLTGPRAGEFTALSQRFSRTQSWLYVWFVVLQEYTKQHWLIIFNPELLVKLLLNYSSGIRTNSPPPRWVSAGVSDYFHKK